MYPLKNVSAFSIFYSYFNSFVLAINPFSLSFFFAVIMKPSPFPLTPLFPLYLLLFFSGVASTHTRQRPWNWRLQAGKFSNSPSSQARPYSILKGWLPLLRIMHRHSLDGFTFRLPHTYRTSWATTNTVRSYFPFLTASPHPLTLMGTILTSHFRVRSPSLCHTLCPLHVSVSLPIFHSRCCYYLPYHLRRI